MSGVKSHQPAAQGSGKSPPHATKPWRIPFFPKLERKSAGVMFVIAPNSGR